MTSATTAGRSVQLVKGRRSGLFMAEVWMICMRGNRPICTDWRATEKAPEMTACEAMTVASVASPRHRDQRPVRREVEEGFWIASGSASGKAP